MWRKIFRFELNVWCDFGYGGTHPPRVILVTAILADSVMAGRVRGIVGRQSRVTWADVIRVRCKPTKLSCVFLC